MQRLFSSKKPEFFSFEKTEECAVKPEGSARKEMLTRFQGHLDSALRNISISKDKIACRNTMSENMYSLMSTKEKFRRTMFPHIVFSFAGGGGGVLSENKKPFLPQTMP